MSEPINEKREYEYADRYDNGRKPRLPAEARVHEAYRELDTALRAMPVPAIDRSQLVVRMAAEADRPSVSDKTAHLRRGFLARLPSPVFAAVCAVSIGVLAFSYFRILQGPETPPVRSFLLRDVSSQETVKGTLAWGFHLQRGHTVTVPRGREAHLELADGSRLRCAPDTCLALSDAGQRRVHLKNGTIFVSAKPGLERPLQVVTELGTVEVTGTEFRVSVIR